MSEMARVDVRYQSRFCTFLKKDVWAIRTQQPDGGWRIVNCLDKDEACFGTGCMFTTDQGEWPYTETQKGGNDQPHHRDTEGNPS